MKPAGKNRPAPTATPAPVSGAGVFLPCDAAAAEGLPPSRLAALSAGTTRPHLVPPARRHAFTLVEIMVVVVIIGLLAALALPAMARVRRNAQTARVVSDLRTFAQGFETYALKNGAWPPDGTPRVLPVGMSGEIKDTAWAQDTAVGGQWDWDYQQFGVTAGISIFQPTADVEQMTEIDRRIDDGDLATGHFRARSNGYIYILQP